MDIEITKEVNEKLNKISSISGLERKKIIEKAISYYIFAVESNFKLKEEFKALDRLSDDALDNFEADL